MKFVAGSIVIKIKEVIMSNVEIKYICRSMYVGMGIFYGMRS